MTSADATGFLSIWTDIDFADETDYLHWLTRQHVQERLSIPGFVGVRAFRTEVEARARYLIFYYLRSPEIVGSEPYLARLNSPSEWSKRVMPRLKNFIRGGGRLVCKFGSGEGAFVTAMLCSRAELPRVAEDAETAVKFDRISATSLFEVDEARTNLRSNEKAMRKGDQSFEGMLLTEALDEDSLKNVRVTPSGGNRLVFRQFFALRK